jgi:hypothetical protein
MTDELFEQRLQRDLHRLAERLVSRSGQVANPAMGLEHSPTESRWRDRHCPPRTGRRGWTRHRLVIRGRAVRVLAILGVIGVLAFGALVSPGPLIGNRTIRLRHATPTAALSHFPGALAYLANGSLSTAQPGDRPTAITPAVAPGSAPQWSVGVRWLAYLGTADHLHVVRPDGTPIAPPVTSAVVGMAWSPTAKLLAILPVGGPRANDLLLWDPTADGAPPRVIASSVTSFVWSSGGKQLAYTVQSATQPDQLVTYDLLMGTRDLLPYRPPTGTGLLLAGWWPDSHGLVFWLDPGHSVAAEATGLELAALPLTANRPYLMGRTFVYQPWLAWSPGGGRLLVVTMSGSFPWQGSQLTMCRPALDRCQGLPQPRGSVSLDPTWSPGGGHIAFVRAAARGSLTSPGGVNRWYQTRRLYEARADGTYAHLVAGAGSGVADPTFSPSGSSIYYVTDQSVAFLPVGGGLSTTVVGGLTGALGTGGPDGYGKLPWGGLAVWAGSNN